MRARARGGGVISSVQNFFAAETSSDDIVLLSALEHGLTNSKTKTKMKKRNGSMIGNYCAAGIEGKKTIFFLLKIFTKITESSFKTLKRRRKNGRKPISALFITTLYMSMVVTWERRETSAEAFISYSTSHRHSQ